MLGELCLIASARTPAFSRPLMPTPAGPAPIWELAPPPAPTPTPTPPAPAPTPPPIPPPPRPLPCANRETDRTSTKQLSKILVCLTIRIASIERFRARTDDVAPVTVIRQCCDTAIRLT